LVDYTPQPLQPGLHPAPPDLNAGFAGAPAPVFQIPASAMLYEVDMGEHILYRAMSAVFDDDPGKHM